MTAEETAPSPSLLSPPSLLCPSPAFSRSSQIADRHSPVRDPHSTYQFGNMNQECSLIEPIIATLNVSIAVMSSHKPHTPVGGTPQYNRGLKNPGAACRELETSPDACRDDLQIPGGRVSDTHLASRKASEAAERRYQAASWLQHMVGPLDLPKEPSEDDLRSCLQNGLVLCNLINKVHPGAVPKIVDHSALSAPPEGVGLSAFQYFENVRNFLVAVEDLKLPTFDASDLEKGGLQIGGSSKVVDCILSVKAYYEWQQSGGQGCWKLGATFKTPGSSRTPMSRTRLACSWLGSGRTSDAFSNSTSKNKDSMEEMEDGCFNSDSGVAWVQHACKKFVDTFIAKSRRSEQMGVLEGPDTDMPREALLNMMLAVLHNKNSEEVVMLVEYMLEKVMEEYQQRTLNSKGQVYSSPGINEPKCSDPLYAHNLVLHNKELEEVKSVLETTRIQFQTFKSTWEKEMEELVLKLHELNESASEYHKIAAENRELYNQVQDLKGNIRVYCRVRPFLPNQSNTKTTIDFVGGKGSIMIANPTKQGKEHRKSFSFNKVFGPSASQEEVFLDTQPLIRSVLDGYNVCIFAYGQTGSGKTYTMTGPNNPSPLDWGVNFRALHDLFKISQHRKDSIKYEVTVQMMEIYNEQVRDLLCTDGVTKKLEIRNNSQQNGLNVPDANLLPVTSIEDVLELMNLGQKNRAVGSTAMNERSSRSHSVLTVHVKGIEVASRDVLRGCLHLVDLAGSERVDKSEVTGDRLREAQHINKSLSALGDVIAALAQKSPHIPYRNSKLTQLLQDSLGGQAKTLMFVHVSPDEESCGETISTLKFAERVATVELGAAQSNKESGELKDLRDQIILLRDTLSKKEGELERCQKELQTRNTEPLPERQRVKPCISPLHLGMQPVLGNLRSPLEEVGNTESRRTPSLMQKSTPTSGLKKFTSVHQDSPLGLSRLEEDCLKRRAHQSASCPTVNPDMMTIGGLQQHAGGSNTSGAKKARASHEGARTSSMPNNRYDGVESSTLEDQGGITNLSPLVLHKVTSTNTSEVRNSPPVLFAVEAAAYSKDSSVEHVLREEEMEEQIAGDSLSEAESREIAVPQRNSDIRASKASFGKRRQDSDKRHGGLHQAGHVAKRPIMGASAEMGSSTAEGTRKTGRFISHSKVLRTMKKAT